jgi:hypothetical protein
MRIFICMADALLFKYLGIHIHYRKILSKEWKLVKDGFERKLVRWIGKMLSRGDCLVPNNSVLTGLPMFLLSFFDIMKGVRKRLDFFRSRFFWKCDNLKKNSRI